MKKFLFVCFFFVTACATKYVPIETQIPIRCEVPPVEHFQYEEIKKQDSYEEKLRKLIHNWGKCKEENEKLRQAIEVCK
uniref:Lipoprotein n=1 Tax=Thermodesulfovibrio aggregans TaxID=86166 RepID=A0A7C4AJW2_9BACT